jgi:N-hydroxyarylamine O-acetyltransferase
MLTVPFENLDIARGRQLVVDPEQNVRKIVDAKRGGFCYELNGAFSVLLQELGFKVTLLSARVSRDDGSDGPEFDHLTLRVDLAEPWLADVGFGDSFVDPLRLVPGIEQEQDGRKFRLITEGAAWRLEKAEWQGAWHAEYSFSLQPRHITDFAGMCHFHQTSPQSTFTRKSICTRATPEGRITLANMKLIITRNGQREEQPVATVEEWNNLLKEHFGVVLGVALEAKS